MSHAALSIRPVDRLGLLPLALDTPLVYLKGVGPARAAMLTGKGLETVEDLLHYFPFRYEDRSNLKTISQIAPGEMATVIAEVRSAKVSGFRRRNLGLFEAEFTDASRAILLGKWFHGAYLADRLTPGTRVALFGKVEFDSYRGELQMMHPETEFLTGDDEEGDAALHVGRIVPVYEAAGKVNTRILRTLMHRILQEMPELEDQLPEAIRSRLRFPSRTDGDSGSPLPDFRHADPHPERLPLAGAVPSHLRGVLLARMRPRSEAAARSRAARHRVCAHRPGSRADQEDAALQADGRAEARPQRNRRRHGPAHPMNRLLQGDVGSGKTIVAAEAAVIAIENGYQVAILAPTEILAPSITSRSSRSPKARLRGRAAHWLVHGTRKTQLKEMFRSGLVPVAVGTHALIEKDVEFAKLGLVIIDEQHRFGVMQRFELTQKGMTPDVLVMTATPIPRTLAMTMYGDLDVSVIDEMPPGRKPHRHQALHGGPD